MTRSGCLNFMLRTRFDLKVATACALLLVAPACKDKKADKASPSTEDNKTTPATSAKTSEQPATDTQPSAQLPADPGGKGGEHAWSIRLGGNKADSGRAIAVADDGTVYVAGMYRDTVDFGDGVKHTASDADTYDGFVVALDEKGTAQWSRVFGGEGDDLVKAVAAFPGGGVVVVGSYANELNLGDGVLPSSGADEVFVARLDKSGKRMWARRFGGIGVDGADGVAIDKDGNIAVIGVYGGGAKVGDINLDEHGQQDILLAMLGPDGEPKWAHGWGGEAADEGRAVGFDSAGNLLILVEFSREIDFGGGPVKSVGNRDMAVIKLTPDGKHVWSSQWGSLVDELALGLTVDPAGNAIITGSFDDVLDFGDGAPMRTAGSEDVFVTKVKSDGSLAWTKRLGSDDEDIGAAVTSDRFGNVYVTGWFWKSMTHGTTELTSQGKKDAFLVAYDPDGNPLWGRTYGGPEDDYGRALAASGDSLYVAGTFHSKLAIGDAQLEAMAAKNAQVPWGDVFAAKLIR